jgi:hypothetical protein
MERDADDGTRVVGDGEREMEMNECGKRIRKMEEMNRIEEIE